MSDWRNELIKDVTNAMFKVENMQCSKLLVSDDFFDRLAVRLRTAWETIEHPHKHLITEDDLWCGSLLLAEDKYPKDVIAEAIWEEDEDED